jgi:N-acetylglucosaminyldiphosphoundecaprenol N-acetyl-beta-D-mannosaminyltransferase
MFYFEEIRLLGTRFHKLTVEQLVHSIVQLGKAEQKTIIGNLNAKALDLSCTLPWYRNFLNRSDLVFCDGFGVLLGAKILGHQVQSVHRMTCPDYIEDLALACEAHNVSIFLLAGRPGVVDKAILKLSAIAPHLRIDGHHGYFEKTGLENDQVIQKVNQFKPDVLYVGFGMPLQEQWILDNFDQIDTHVFLPLGACLDFYTGTVYRGPKWMTDRGLEWLSRLLTEPKRLWKRYFVGNFLLLYRIIQQRLTLDFYNDKNR